MKILVVAATENELNPVIQSLDKSPHDITFLVTGIGMIATTFFLTDHLNSITYDLAINVGIAGAFDRSIERGDVLEVVQDQFAEELVEDGPLLKSYDEIGLRAADSFPFVNGVLRATHELNNRFLKKVSAITINTVHGNETSIKSVQERLGPEIESMEGAAFFYVCHQKKLPCMQIRSISNYVEKRNRSEWKIDVALNNLAEVMPSIIHQL